MITKATMLKKQNQHTTTTNTAYYTTTLPHRTPVLPVGICQAIRSGPNWKSILKTMDIILITTSTQTMTGKLIM